MGRGRGRDVMVWDERTLGDPAGGHDAPFQGVRCAGSHGGGAV